MSNEITRADFNNILDLRAKQQKLQTQIVTGQSILQPADDPSRFSQAMDVNAELKDQKQYSSNVAEIKGVLQSTYDVLVEMKDVAIRSQELLLLTTPITQESAKIYSAEVNTLVDQLVHLLGQDFRDTMLFGGDKIDTLPYDVVRNPKNEATSISYTGTPDVAKVFVSKVVDIPARLHGSINQKLADFGSHLIALRDLMGANSPDMDAVQAQLPNLKNDLTCITSAIGDVGGRLSQIKVLEDQSEEIEINLKEQRAALIGLDLASAIAEYRSIEASLEGASKTWLMQLNSEAGIFKYILGM